MQAPSLTRRGRSARHLATSMAPHPPLPPLHPRRWQRQHISPRLCLTPPSPLPTPPSPLHLPCGPPSRRPVCGPPSCRPLSGRSVTWRPTSSRQACQRRMPVRLMLSLVLPTRLPLAVARRMGGAWTSSSGSASSADRSGSGSHEWHFASHLVNTSGRIWTRAPGCTKSQLRVGILGSSCCFQSPCCANGPKSFHSQEVGDWPRSLTSQSPSGKPAAVLQAHSAWLRASLRLVT